jgi:hypothetical protein
MKLVVVGNPGSRRVAMYAEAARAAGLPPVGVLSWREILSGTCAVPVDSLIKVDSPGEDPQVDRLLRGNFADPHGVSGTEFWYRNFAVGLKRLGEVVAATPGARLLNNLDDIAVMFDKRSCHKQLAAAGCPVPPAFADVSDFDEVHERMREVGWNRVFLKPAHGSSASGVVALQVNGDRVVATTSVAVTREGPKNSLRIRTYRDGQAKALVDVLCADPMHVERWFPKASLQDRNLDLRVVVTAGRVTHAIGRAGRYPMTNLHLGSARVDAAEVRAAAGESRWQEWMDTCERVAAVFPDTFMMGVDLLPGVGWERHAIGEVNAFGDLLPGLTGLPDGPAAGLDTYGAQIAALSCRT